MFQMAMQHKSKLHIYKELKQEIGFVEYLEYAKGAACTLVFKYYSHTHGFSDELGRHVRRGGSQECPNCEACKELVSMCF